MNVKKIIILVIAIILILGVIGLLIYLSEANKVPLADIVKIGDYIQYNAGEWNDAEINKLTSQKLYAGADSVTFETPYMFGGFKSGDSRNVGIVYPGASTESKTGWRVLDIDKSSGVVTIVSNGITEAFYYPGEEYGGYIAEEVLNVTESIPYDAQGVTQRDWKMYVNGRVATDATCMMKSNVDKITNNIINFNDVVEVFDIVNIKSNYWLGTAYGQSLLYSINSEGIVNSGNNKAYGIRVIVHLKSNIKISPSNSGNGSETLPWKI